MAKTNATSDWIPVGVRLPDANQSVLVCFGTQVTIAVRYLDEWTTDDGGMLKGEWVSHWMPLPELPAVDERATIQSSKRTNKAGRASQTPYGVE